MSSRTEYDMTRIADSLARIAKIMEQTYKDDAAFIKGLAELEEKADRESSDE